MRKIPARFELLGSTITVKVRDDLYDEAECYGRWTPSKHLIELQEVGPDVTKTFQLQTFWHEVMHAVFDNIGRPELSEDEALVDLVGQCIHQVLKTKR